MNYFYTRILVVLLAFISGFINSIQSQCYTPPSYCTNITASNVSSYGMGIQNVTLNTAAIPVQINNTTSPGLGSPIYFDYTSQTLTAASGAVVNYSIRGGNSNQTKIRLFIDFDNNGTFNTTPIATAGGELVLDLANMTVANTTVSGTFTLPTLSAGSYRIRVASDGQGIIPPPCGPTTYSADYEDYTLMVASGTADAIVTGILQPTVLAASPAINPVSFTVRNLTNTTMTSISAGYTVNGGTATTQTFTGLSIASGASYTVTFSTGFTVSTLGNYAIKYFLYDVNGTTTQNSPLNDTICQTIPLLCTGPLTGSYTIDPAGGFTATNFTSFTNAVNALRACGVSGPVNFSVAAGTYTDTLYIPNIAGVSATNTITFDGGNGNKATRILTYPTSSNANAVVRFNMSRFVTVRNMTLRSTGAAQGWVVHCMNDSNDRVNNCTIEFTGAATTSSSSSFAGIVLNNSLTNISTSSTNCRNIVIDSNLLNSGYYNIYTAINANTFTNTFNYNNFSNAFYNGIQLNGAQGAQVRFNQFNLRSTNTSGMGVFANSINPSGTNVLNISSNQLNYCGQYGIYIINSNGSATNHSIVANNMITGFANTGGNYGIAFSSASRFNIYHNSVSIPFNATSGTSAGVHLNSTNTIDVRNNILSMTGAASINTFPVFAQATNSFSFLNYNNYFNLSSPNLAQIAGVNLTAANYKTASPANAGANSISENAGFISSTNLHTTNPCFNGLGGLGITQDIDGQTRAGTPDMGADELTTVPNDDASVFSITTPNFPLVSGAQTVSVVIKNNGANTISTLNINYSLNNGTVVSEPYAGAPISPCATVVFNFTTPVTIGSGTSNFKAYTTSPNGSSDAVPANDTAQWTLCNAMSGTYTINPLGSGSTNFTSFTSAIAALNCGGVNGAVTFNVSNGTYAEQLFLAPIPGASATNTIKFQSLSGVAANCIISFSTPSSQAIIDLNGADFITFDKFTIRNTFTSTGFGVWIRNGADFNTISNCIIDMAASGVNGYGVYQSGSMDNRNTINGNTINGAGYGVFLNANSSTYSNRNVISNNAINGSYYYGIYSYYQDSVIISGNTITSSSANSSYSGIYAYWSRRGPIIAKNKIVFTSTRASSGSYYGMNLEFFNVSTSNPTRGLIANNMIQVGGAFSTAYGIFMQNSCNYSDIIHNSVNMTNTAANGSYALYMNSGLSYDTVRNNIFQNIGNGTTSGYAAFIYPGTQMFYNNNDFYTRNSNFALYNGTSYANYAAWKAAAAGGIPGFEAAGVSREVTFTSSTDLHTTLPCIADIGYNYTSTSPSINKVLDDYDGQARSTTPDLGCDEFTTAPFDLATQLMTSPTGSVFALATPYTIRTVVRNNGSTTITALDMSYSVNGGAATSQSFTGLNLLPCDTITLTFTSPLTLTASGSNALKIFNGLINTSNADGNNTNDTLIANLCTSYSGTYSINKNLPFSSSNFTSVSQAVNSLYSCGMSGPVVLRIDAGSGPYNEQVTFNGMIPGLNRTNNLRISGNTTRETITFNPTVATLQHTIRLITVKHITLDSLTINNTGASFGVGVHLVTTADSNFVTNSNINISLASASLSNSAGIAISTNTSNVTTAGNNGNNNVFDNNTITGGYFGISAVGTSTTVFCKRNDVTNNRLFGQAFYGIYWYNQDSTKINGNTIDNMLSSNVNSFGMDLRYTERFELKRNKINRTGQYGIYLANTNFQNGTGTVRSEISNNMIGGMFYNTNPSGVYTQTQFRNIDFWHNTINVVNLGNGNAFNMNQNSATTHTGLDFRNNTFTATNNIGAVGYFYYTNSNPFSNFLNNNIWGSNSSVSQALFSCSNYNTNQWIQASLGSCQSGPNTSSCKWQAPQFNNDLTDLHSLSSSLSNWGTNIGAVTSDIDGDTRPLSPSSTVDVGADEYNIPALNIGAASVVTPVAPMTIGTQDVIIQIKNHGATTITSANVSYKVGVNGSVKTVAWTGSIANNATANVTFTGANQYNFTGAFDTVIAWTDAPNGGVDAYIFNDTFVNNVVCQPLTAGTYTIDPGLPASASNFVNFSSLASRLNNCGVTGPVTVNVAAGTYTEQFELKQYPGVSAVNTVTIQSASGIASSVNLQFNTATLAANNYVVYMNGADYTRFQNMTMTNSNTGIGSYIIWQLNNSRFNTFQNIIFNGANTSSTSQQYSIIYSNNNNAVQLNQGDDNNTINQCTFNNGSYGIYYNGSYSPYYTYNTTITNNTFSQQSAYATYLYFHINFNFSGNTITTSTANSFYGLYVYNGGVQANSASQFTTISKNNFNITNNGYGMYLQYVNGTNSSPVIYPIVSNNFIKIGSGTGTAYGLFASYSHARYYHNTFNVTSGSTTTPAVYLQYGCCYSPLQEFKFNIVANSGNGTNAGQCIFSDMNTASQVKIDSNVYFQGTGATNFGSLNATNYATFAAWKTGMGVTFDPASLVANPNFFSSTNLRINSGVNLRPVPVSPFVTDDIDNLNRCGITDVGADHHPAGLDAGVSAITSPANGVASPGLQDVKVLLTNIGSTTLTSANVSYNINGTVQTKAWTGSLATCASDTIVFTGAQQYNFTGSFTMKAFSSAPNGGADPNATNDTAYSSGCVGMGGVYTIGGTPGPTNFATFGAAITAMQGCGIGSAVTFEVASGTYTEQVSIPAITGASATNTITFDGGNGNVATRILTFATGASGSGLSHVLRFNNCSNVFFRNMTIRSSGASEAWTVHFMNGVNNRLFKCIVDMTGNGTTSGSTNFASVVINGSTTNRTTFSTIANNHRVDSCAINFGFYGIYSFINNGALTNFFTNNNFTNSHNSGGWFESPQTVKFNNNTINTRSTNTTSQPIYFSSANPSGSNFNEVNGNTIVRTGQQGIYFINTQGGVSTQGQCYNNFINGMTTPNNPTVGIFLNNASNWNLYHNTVNHDINSTSGPNYGIQIQNGSNNDVRNNILSTTIPTAVNWTPLFINPSSAASAVNSNNYWNPSSSNLVHIGGVNYTAANFKVAYPSGGGLNSINLNPAYVSSSNIHVTSACNNGENLGVLVDIDGQTRAGNPDMGADEVTAVPNNDIQVMSITTPAFPLVAGSQPVTVVIRNVGNNVVSSFDVNYRLNNGTVVTQAYSGSPINPCASASFTFSTNVTIVSGSNDLSVFTTAPNGVADVNPANDTARYTSCIAMSGTYTINASGSGPTNFTTFTAAVNNLICGGVSGPVTSMYPMELIMSRFKYHLS
jgi:parallel beta-helix repeat protein